MPQSTSTALKGGKIILFGLAGAGKTSIHHRCFLKSDIEEIEKLPPTLLMSVDSPPTPFLHEELSLWDLGGQEGYIKSHLSDPQIFRNVRAIIYVVDLEKRENLPKAKAHFASVEKIVNQNQEQANRFVFLHKFDPDKRKEFAKSLTIFLAELQSVLPPDTVYYSTSIYDDSACKGITNVLYSAFPVEVLRQAFSGMFLPELYQKFSTDRLQAMAGSSSGVQAANKKIFDVFTSLGRAIGKNLKVNWSNILKGISDFRPSEGRYLKFESLPGRKIRIAVDCVFEEQNMDDLLIDVCLMTQGLLSGVVGTLRLGEVEEEETMLHDKDKGCTKCHFLVHPLKGLESQFGTLVEES